MKKFGGDANTPNAANLNRRFTMKIILHETNGLQISQCHEDGYINATQMCQAHDKDLSKWLANDSTFDLVAALAKRLDIKFKSPKLGNSVWTRVSATFPTLVRVKRGSPETGGGTWIHHKLAVPLAMWISPEFALLVSDWVEQWLMTGQNPLNMATANPPISPEVLELIEAHTRRSESLNRTIHTAIHQQINAIKDTLKVLEGRLESSETITIEAVKTTTPQKNEEITKVAVRRLKGEGSGSIHWRTYTKNGRQYRQAFFHYELWEGGDRLIKSCKYIPKEKVAAIQDLQTQKASIVEILRVLS